MKHSIALLLFIQTFICASELPWSALIHTNSFYQDIEILKMHAEKKLFLESVMFFSDVAIDLDECTYLTQLSPRISATVADIIRGLIYLHAKHCFETITVEFLPAQNQTPNEEPAHIHLHITLSGLWRFSGLTIKGMFIGKDIYRQYYTFKKGDAFDYGKHRACIERMQDLCKSDGYCDAQISGQLHKDSITKTVHTTLHVQRGALYTIHDISLHIDSQHEMSTKLERELQKKIYEQFLRPLVGTFYAKSRLSAVAKAIKNWCAQQGYLQVNIELQEQVRPAVHHIDLRLVLELNNKKNFHFLGNTFFSAAQLMEQLLAFGSTLSILPAELLAEELTQWYKKRGFWHVTIQAHEEHEDCFFTIYEGGRTIIDDIIIKGVAQFDNKKLKKQFFHKIIRAKEYDPELINQSRDKLIAFYLDEGFWNCSCIDHVYDPVPDKENHYMLVMTLEEGQRSFIEQVIVEPFASLAHEGILEYATRHKIPFTVQHVQEQRAYLETRMRQMGYGHASMHVEVVHDGIQVCLVWKINTNESVPPFGKTIIQGSTTIPFAYIMRELAYTPASPFNRTLLDVTRNRLQSLQLFEQIHCYPTKIEGIDHEQPILLHLHQDEKFEVRLRAGLGLQQVTRQTKFGGLTYKAGGSFFVKNPFHRADYIRIDADVTRSYQRWHAWYIQPWLFHFPIQTSVHGYAHRYQQPGLASGRKSLYEFWQRGILLELHRVWSWYECGLNIGVEWMKTTIAAHMHTDMFHKQIARALSFEPALLGCHIPYFLWEPTFFVNLLDNSLDPHRGSLTVLSCKAMIPLAVLSVRSYFIKLLAEQSLFFPLYQSVCGLHLRIGHMFHKKFENIMPAERFYLGGAHSIRSYQTDMCPPLGCITNDNGTSHRVPQGARSLLHASAEVRIPLYDRVVGAVFQDIGFLSNNLFTDISRERVLAGTGFGLRIKTPVGPLRFDIAWKWYKMDQSESSYAWFLTFGHAF